MLPWIRPSPKKVLIWIGVCAVIVLLLPEPNTICWDGIGTGGCDRFLFTLPVDVVYALLGVLVYVGLSGFGRMLGLGSTVRSESPKSEGGDPGRT